MKTDNINESKNIEDRRGQSSSSGYSYGSGSGSSLNTGLLSLIFSRMGWKGKILLLLVFLMFGGMSSLGNLGLGSSSINYNSYDTSQVESAPSDVSDEEAVFMSKVLATTEEFWTQEFAERGKTYSAPKMVFYTDAISTGCGQGSTETGPFYCSADQKVYIDISFYRELTTKYNAAGDFAMAYVIAHEVGHHVQNELGTMNAYYQKRQTLSEKDANALNVRLELQADYYAGAWAKYVEEQGYLEMGDIDEAMQAAHAVGDDTLQEEAYGRTMPDSFTHGTSEQRQYWFNRGYQYGDIEHGDTFSANI
ncbi:KPN_02809 family neutral zinc metallopeptidase [Streptococcus caprae]|uniref:Neutral zinc metallopeptidase n=1 Tax=Streptococcus caprae TaxID=1640501 RepID=A0ABV8CYL9_9STRE